MRGKSLTFVSRKFLYGLLIAVGGLFVVAVGAKPLGRAYLRSHHSNVLAALATLVVPPDDLYSPVLLLELQNASKKQIEITHRYAGRYVVIGRFASTSHDKIEGELDCGTVSVILHRSANIFDHNGGGTELGRYVIEGNATGRPLRCQITLKFEGYSADLGLEIGKLSDL